MATIRKLVLKNFKCFRTLELDFDPELNILVGGNEAGKSSVLQALDIVLSASRSKLERLLRRSDIQCRRFLRLACSAVRVRRA